MNLIFGTVVEVDSTHGPRTGKVRVGGATQPVSLDLLPDVCDGDRVLLCDGVAIGKVLDPHSLHDVSTIEPYVSRNPR